MMEEPVMEPEVEHPMEQQNVSVEQSMMEEAPPINQTTTLINPTPLSLWRELASARDRGLNFDLELRCGMDRSPPIFCHKLILGSCSDFLRDVICLSEDECVIILPEFDYYHMRDFVNGVYNNFLTYGETSDIYLPKEFVDALGLLKPRMKRMVKVEEDHHQDASKFLQMVVKTEAQDHGYGGYGGYDNDRYDDDYYDYKPRLPYPSDNGILYGEDFDFPPLKPVKKRKPRGPNKPRAKKIKTENGEDGPTMVSCEECDEIFPSFRQHLVHKRKVHMPNEKVFVSCRLCRKESSVRKFPRHLAKFHMTHICDVCGSEHETWAKLYDHKRYTHHTFPCNICDYKCVGRIELERHKATEHGCSFHCEFCGKVFQRRKCLTNHKRYVHTPDKDKKYQCKYCGKGYGGKSHLQSHVSSAHTKDRPFFCRFQCGARFNADCNVVKHERAKHGRSFLDRPKPPVVPMPF